LLASVATATVALRAQADIMSDTILFEVSDGLAHLTLNRPERLNAIDGEAAHRWRDLAIQVAERDDIRAVLFDAAGPAFCAGGDVAAMATTGGDGSVVAGLADVIHEGHRMFSESPKPIVAAVHGAVAGGGLGFMLVADYVVASEAAFFVSKYADIGLTPDCGVSTLLPQAVGVRRALQLLLTDRSLTAVEGLEWGLVAEVVPADDLRDRTRRIAEHWLAGATGAYGQAKRLVRSSVGRSYQDGLDDEARTIGAAFETPDARARVAAFLARSAR
jgi:2-(1,2-epoxy-1,2-dihydrophenyl)acetyl-CoA isomerase